MFEKNTGFTHVTIDPKIDTETVKILIANSQKLVSLKLKGKAYFIGIYLIILQINIANECFKPFCET